MTGRTRSAVFQIARVATPLCIAALMACQGGAGDDAANDTAMQPDSTATAAALGTATPAPATGALLDPNEATREQLVAVPGMTEAAADSLVAGRPYENMLAVNGALAALDSTTRATIYTRLWKPLDLNTASGDEILLIPGVGPRMRHEFEEYRPYSAIAQFRREIGKYVDDAEVARLERYVTIR
jgi:DNA uptake protein ComE-like DNA-binding protein